MVCILLIAHSRNIKVENLKPQHFKNLEFQDDDFTKLRIMLFISSIIEIGLVTLIRMFQLWDFENMKKFRKIYCHIHV